MRALVYTSTVTHDDLVNSHRGPDLGAIIRQEV